MLFTGRDDLINQWELLKRCNWSDNIWKSYRSRWKKYTDFCDQYNYEPTPATIECVCIYITYLCQSVSYSSVDKYVGAVWALHDYCGIQSVNRQAFLIKATLAGARRLLGDQTVQVDPLMPEDMLLIRASLKVSVWQDFTFWVALVLSYRCLLRVGHVTISDHSLRVKDIIFTPSGMDVYM